MRVYIFKYRNRWHWFATKRIGLPGAISSMGYGQRNHATRSARNFFRNFLLAGNKPIPIEEVPFDPRKPLPKPKAKEKAKAK